MGRLDSSTFGGAQSLLHACFVYAVAFVGLCHYLLSEIALPGTARRPRVMATTDKWWVGGRFKFVAAQSSTFAAKYASSDRRVPPCRSLDNIRNINLSPNKVNPWAAYQEGTIN